MTDKPQIVQYMEDTRSDLYKRPRTSPSSGGVVVATPMDAVMAELTGYLHFEGVGFTRDQKKRLAAYYGFTDAYIQDQVDSARAKHEERQKKIEEKEAEKKAQKGQWYRASYGAEPALRPFDEEAIRKMHQAGSDRNLLRHVRSDGLRVMAFLSKYLERHEDPVEFLEGLCSEVGLDCPLSDWDQFKPEEW